MALRWHCDICRRTTQAQEWGDRKFPPTWMRLSLKYVNIDMCPACVIDAAKKLEKQRADKRESRNAI